MIQFRRGTTKSWKATKVKLAAGQPGFDKDKYKIKIGDGKSDWSDLPYVSGLSSQEILDSEQAAQERYEADNEDITLITYGTDLPDENTVGQLYLQQCDTPIETDYIVKSGINGIWSYQIWKSGIARCHGILPVTTDIQTVFDGVNLYHDNNKMSSIAYPFTFKELPSETATVQSPGWVTWIASRSVNTTKASGVYSLISPNKQATSAVYNISLQIEGLIKE